MDQSNISHPRRAESRLGKSIKETLRYLDLPTDMTTIRDKRPNEWKHLVSEKIEIKNRARLVEECHKKVNGQKVRKVEKLQKRN